MKFSKIALIIILTALIGSIVFYIVMGSKLRSARDSLLSMKATLQNVEQHDEEINSLRELLLKSRAKAAAVDKLKAENERTLELLRTALQENDSLHKEISQLKELLAQAEQAEHSAVKRYSLTGKRETQAVGARHDAGTDTQVLDRNTIQTSRSVDDQPIQDTSNDTGDEMPQLQEEMYDSYSTAPAEVKPPVARTGFASRARKRISLSSSQYTNALYIGAKKCKACHMKEYTSWQKTNMAESFENLKAGVKANEKKKAGLDANKDYTHDEGCLKCHTTGYGLAGGFTSIEKTPELAGVQCEGCHGPGSEYSAVMKKNKSEWKNTGYTSEELKAIGLVIPSEDEAGCMTCHGGDSPFNEKVDARYKFDFEERLKNTHEHYPLKYKKEH